MNFNRDVLKHVVTYHQRIGAHACMCGELKIGTYYSDHIADKYVQVMLGTYVPRHVEEIRYTWPTLQKKLRPEGATS